MTAIGVLLPSPGYSQRVASLAEHTGADAEALITASIADAVSAVAGSGGEWYVIPTTEPTADSFEVATVIDTIVEASPDGSDPVLQLDPITTTDGISPLIELLREHSEEATMALVNPITPFLERRHIDAAAMRLRRHDVVIGPGVSQQWYYLGVKDTVSLHASKDDFANLPVINEGLDQTTSIDLLPYLPDLSTAHGCQMLPEQLALIERTQRHGAQYSRAVMQSE